MIGLQSESPPRRPGVGRGLSKLSARTESAMGRARLDPGLRRGDGVVEMHLCRRLCRRPALLLLPPRHPTHRGEPVYERAIAIIGLS